jgi:hypothetical protein
MNFKFLLLSLLVFTLFLQSNSGDTCSKDDFKNNCGPSCTGTPKCGAKKYCGNKDNMCYCDCNDDYTCKTTELGYKWNSGVKLTNGSYALNGTKGDGKQYIC